MAFGSEFDMRCDHRPDLRVDADTAPPAMSVSGELDALSADLLRTAVADVLRRHRPERIDMDLHGVTFLDSAGIRALLLCQSDAQRAGSRVTLSRARPGVHRVLEITGLLDHFGLGRSGRSYDAVTTFRPVAQ